MVPFSFLDGDDQPAFTVLRNYTKLPNSNQDGIHPKSHGLGSSFEQLLDAVANISWLLLMKLATARHT